MPGNLEAPSIPPERAYIVKRNSPRNPYHVRVFRLSGTTRSRPLR